MSKYDAAPQPVIGHFVTPSPRDDRDHIRPLARLPVALPAEYVLPMPPIRNQAGRGSCGAFGAICALEHEYHKAGVTLDGSEEYQYAKTRELMNATCQDAGSVPRVAMSVLVDFGATSETQVPYESRDLCWRPGPEPQPFPALEYFKAGPSRDALKQTLYGTDGTDGHVIAYCTMVGSTFSVDGGGFLHNQNPVTQPWPGAHWMELVGYSDSRGAWRVRNQWGLWGDGGYCWIRYADAERAPEQGGMWLDDAWCVRIGYQPQPEPEPPWVEPVDPANFNRIWTAGFQAGWQSGWDAHR